MNSIFCVLTYIHFNDLDLIENITSYVLVAYSILLSNLSYVNRGNRSEIPLLNVLSGILSNFPILYVDDKLKLSN
jgi:hypothetical protein